MLDTGYLYANDEKRLFINTSLGCTGSCTYCYLPKLGFKNKKVMSAEEIIEYLENSDYNLSKNTLITLGCFSECFDDNNKQETLKLLEYFLKRGNQVQLSTKKYISKEEISSIIPLIKYHGQFIIFISSATITMHSKIERNTESIETRFKTFNLLKENIPVVLYIKPVLKDITINDLDLYKKYIKKYKIDNVVIGSIFTDEKSSETVPFSNKNELYYNPISDEDILIRELSSICNTFRKSTSVTRVLKK